MKSLAQIKEGVKKSPKKAFPTVKRLMDELGDDLNGTVEMEVPEKFAALVEEFNSKVEDPTNTKSDGKKVPKISVKAIVKDLQSGKTKKVSFKIGKFKSLVLNNGKKFAEDSESKSGEGEEKNESISLLDDMDGMDPMNEVVGEGTALAVVSIVTGIGYLLGLGIFVYTVYVLYLAVLNKEMTVLEEEGTGNVVLSVLLFLFANLIWALMVHAKIKRHEKNGKSKTEGLDMDNPNEYDSILESMGTPHTSNDGLDSNQKDHDSQLLEAYRKVVDDLTRRVPRDNNPMK